MVLWLITNIYTTILAGSHLYSDPSLSTRHVLRILSLDHDRSSANSTIAALHATRIPRKIAATTNGRNEEAEPHDPNVTSNLGIPCTSYVTTHAPANPRFSLPKPNPRHIFEPITRTSVNIPGNLILVQIIENAHDV
jgi:hypothetical protein